MVVARLLQQGHRVRCLLRDPARSQRLKGLEYARRLIDSAKIRLGTFPLPVECDGDEETYGNLSADQTRKV